MGYTTNIWQNENEQLLKDFYNKSADQGKLDFFLKRYPGFYKALSVEGNDSKVFSISENNENMAGAFIRSVKECYINGMSNKIAYLGSIRIARDKRGGYVLNKLIQLLYSVKQTDPKIYLCSMMQNNLIANRIFPSGRSGLPVFRQIGIFKTLIFKACKQKAVKPADLEIRNAVKGDLKKIVKFLNTEGKKMQLFPQYNEMDFQTTSGLLRDLQLNDLKLAWKNNEIAGTLAVWDQSNFRQWIMESRSTFYRLIFPAFRLYSRIRSLPLIPYGSKNMKAKYISLVCVKNNDPEIFQSLLTEAVKQEYEKSKNTILIMGYFSHDKMYSKVRIPCIKLNSNIFAFSWKEHKHYLNSIDFTNSYIETAAL